MKERCPSAKFVAVAKLTDHSLQFTRRSVNRGCGVADAVPERGKGMSIGESSSQLIIRASESLKVFWLMRSTFKARLAASGCHRSLMRLRLVCITGQLEAMSSMPLDTPFIRAYTRVGRDGSRTIQSRHPHQ